MATTQTYVPSNWTAVATGPKSVQVTNVSGNVTEWLVGTATPTMAGVELAPGKSRTVKLAIGETLYGRGCGATCRALVDVSPFV